MPYVYAYDHRHDLPLTELALVIGGKAANIATMATELGLPVPPAFTITTAACNRYLAVGWPDGLDEEIRDADGAPRGHRRPAFRRPGRPAARLACGPAPRDPCPG